MTWMPAPVRFHCKPFNRSQVAPGGVWRPMGAPSQQSMQVGVTWRGIEDPRETPIVTAQKLGTAIT